MVTKQGLLSRLTIEQLLRIKRGKQAIVVTITPDDAAEALINRAEELEAFLNDLSEEDAITDLPPS